jgi:hypothetical protein
MRTSSQIGGLAWYREALMGLVAIVLCGHGQAHVSCALPSDVVVTQTAHLRFGGRSLNVAALSLLADPNESQSRLLVLDDHCRTVLDETVDGLESRFAVRMLGKTRLLQFVTMQIFGDGTGYVQRLFLMRNGQLTDLLPPISHTGKDGFYLGPLTGGQGDGVVTWIADPSGESEADAHPYVVDVWRWRSGRLIGPMTYETTKKYLPSIDVIPRSNVVAKEMGLPYRDQTGTSKFMNPGHLMKLQEKVEQDGGR